MLKACGAALAAVLMVSGAQAQSITQSSNWAPGDWMKQSLVDGLSKAAAASELSGYGFMRGSFCVLGAMIEEHGDARMIYHLDAGQRVLFIGGADNDARDIDITVYNEDTGVLVARDRETDRTPVVEFTVPSSGRYRVELDLYDSTAPSFCTLMALEAGQLKFNMNEVALALDSLIDTAGAASGRHSGVDYAMSETGWSLYGVLLDGRGSHGVTNVSSGRESAVIVGTTGRSGDDLDLVLLNDSSREIDADRERDNLPVISRAEGLSQHTIRLVNAGSGSTTFATALILTPR